MRLHANSTDGPLTTAPPSGEPTCGAAGFWVGFTTDALLYGPQPSPLHAATITDACPAGTGSVTLVAPVTCRAATVRDPPPGPAACWITCTWYHSVPATAVQLTFRLLPPLTTALVIVGAAPGTAPSAT